MRRAAVLMGILPVLAATPEPLFRMPSGLTVVLRPEPVRPLVRLTLRVDLPSDLAEADLQLLGAAMARGGAGPFPAQVLARQMAVEGHAWAFGVRGRTLVWSVLADSQDQEGAAELLAHQVLRPDLVEGWQRLQAEGKDRSGRQVFRALRAQDPAHWVLPEGGTLLRLLALGRSLLRPERASLTLQGDVTAAQARQLALLQFGTWRPGDPDPLPDPAPRMAGARVLVAPGPEGRVLRVALRPISGPEGLQAASKALLTFRLRGLFLAGDDGLVHQRVLEGGENHLKALQALLAELDRRLARAPGTTDLHALEAARAAERLRQGLEPARALEALPDALSPDQMPPLLDPAALRSRLVVLLEGAGPEDQAALANLGLGPVQPFNR